MSKFGDLNNRLGYIVLVYGLAIVALVMPWEEAWVIYASIVAVIIMGELFFQAFGKTITNMQTDTGFLERLSVLNAVVVVGSIAFGVLSTILVYTGDFGTSRLMIVAAAPLGYDSFAYLGGRGLEAEPSRFRLVRVLSPNKSDAGFTFGYVVGAISVLVAWALINAFAVTGWGLLDILPLAVILPAVAIAGDLIESGTKRWLGIKDFSGILGDHGGVTDRFDALGLTMFFYVLIF